MKTRLTLSINSKTVKIAKQFAEQQNTSVSDIFEQYFLRLERIQQNLKKVKNPWIEKFAGIYDPTNEYTNTGKTK